MKKLTKLISLFVLICLVVGCFAGCQEGTDPTESSGSISAAFVDYVAETKLNESASDTLKLEVTVKSYIDGDTTHFHVPTEISADGVLKARYLCVNTPESTGKIEEWGKKASNFTKEKLSSATSIIIESNDGNWNLDSTGGRHLVWVWYRTSDSEDYRCLNLELIQNGLSISCGTVAERYGDVASQAFQQAKAQKLNVFSGENDPDFYYGDAYEVDLKGLRTNIEQYRDMSVAFTGIITRNNSNSVYIEQYDAETDMYYGITVYYGYMTGTPLTILQVGNEARIVGKVQYYEAGGTWQVSGLSYSAMRPKDPNNIQLISTGHTASNRLTDPAVFANGTVEVEVLTDINGDETTVKTFDYAELSLSTSVQMKNLSVKEIYTTHNGGNNDGAMTLTCEVDGVTVSVRTIVLYDENSQMLTEQDFQNKTIDVTGVVDYYDGAYQIKVFSANDIIIHEGV